MKILRPPLTWFLALLIVAAAATAIFGSGLWHLAPVAAFQALGRWLKTPMTLFTFLGDEQFYLVVIPLVYWCLHKGLGADLGVLLVLSSFTNTGLKSFFKHSRPFWADPRLALGDATSFSTPSGHAQTSAALFGRVAWLQAGGRRGQLWGIGIAILVLLIALSRVYLGVHFPGDILWGATVGAGLLALYGWLKPRLLPRLKKLSLAQHALLAAITAALMLGIVSLALSIPFGSGQLFGELYTEAWGNALEDGATVAGLVCGLWLGLVLESRYVRFSVAGPWWQRIVRYLVGAVGLAAIWMGLKLLFPTEPLALGLALRVVRYGLAMLWAIMLWPWLFVKIGLGTRMTNSPEEASR